MKKAVLLALGVAIVAPVAMADAASDNIFLLQKSGVVEAVPVTDKADQMTFNDNIFQFTNNSATTTETTFSGGFTIKVNDEEIKSFATKIVEVGVVYSWFHANPVYGIDGTMKLGFELKSDAYTFTIHGLDHGVTYYVRPYIRIMGKVYYSNATTYESTAGEKQTLSLKTRIYSAGFPDLESDVERVDIYLSRYNVGSCTEGNPGSYFAWGEIETKDEYTWDNYKWSKGDTITAYIPDESSAKSLSEADDVANVAFGNDYHCTPNSLISELLTYAFNYSWSSRVAPDGSTVNGWELKDQDNANPVFIPAGGYYNGTTLVDYNIQMLLWTNKTCPMSNPKDSFAFRGTSTKLGSNNAEMARYLGIPVRSVTITRVEREPDDGDGE